MYRHVCNSVFKLFIRYVHAYSLSPLQSYPTLCHPMDSSLPGFCVHGDSPGKNTGVGCHALLQGIFPTRDWTIKPSSLMSPALAGVFFTTSAIWEAPELDLPTWVDSRSRWWTGRPGVLQFMGSQRVEHDWATELNWTDATLVLTGCGLNSQPCLFQWQEMRVILQSRLWLHT